MIGWDAATWAQVVIAAVGLVVAIAATWVALLTYRFTIDSQPVEIEFVRDERPSRPGTVPMHLLCRSPRAYVHQLWSPDWVGRDRRSAPDARMFGKADATSADCLREDLSQGGVRMFDVEIPAGVSSFQVVATASVDKRGRKRNVWSEPIVVALPARQLPKATHG
ncbi:hypothetical protein [uncultured Microbacterium sp.]|uniref:hypothetical protein n=1 Tax=uncultured Microbacterium sp. TaxID=191216 RepID=UPI0028EE9F8C|nr:hypothetical protein [uncultured Microbacterium sp.]